MDPTQKRDELAKQVASLVVVMVSYVASRIRGLFLNQTHNFTVWDVMLTSIDSIPWWPSIGRLIENVYPWLGWPEPPFFALCDLFRTRGLVPKNHGCSVEEQVAMFLLIVWHNQRFRVVHQAFRRSIETVHKHFHQVLYVVGELRNELIKPLICHSFKDPWQP
jgi:hypothetical protein